MNRIIKLWLPILMLLLITTVSAQEPYYVLDFAEEPLGPWTELDGVRVFQHEGSQPVVVEAPSRSGRSIKLMGPNELSMIGDCFYYILPEPVTDKLTIEASVYLESNVDRSLIIFASPLEGSPYGDGPSLYFHNEGSLRYYDTAFRILDVKYPARQWIDVKLELNIPEQYYDIYIDNFDFPVARAPFRNPACTEIQIVGFTVYTHMVQPKPVYVDTLIVY